MHPDRERLREAYQRQFPRNPELRHAWWIRDEQRASDTAAATVPALCGAPILVADTQSPTPSRRRGFAKPGRIYDNAGMSDWVGMDCVDCLRAYNATYARQRRRELNRLLTWYLAHHLELDDRRVDALLKQLRER